MSEQIYKGLLKELIKKEVADAGGPKEMIERTLGEARLQELTYRIELLTKAGASEGEIYEQIGGEIRASLPRLLSHKPEFKDSLHSEFYHRLQAKDKESTTWGDIFEEVYEGEYYQSEIFVRLVEEQEGVEITSPEQLQELTGITAVYQGHPSEGPQALNADLYTSYVLYSYHLEQMLQEGAKYQELLQIEPQTYNLPQTWEGCLASNKREAILWAINLEYKLGDKTGFKLTPDLRTIAKELEAPYSEIMEAYKTING